MSEADQTPARRRGPATHTFRVVVEPDADAWHAYCPALKAYGAATWGTTREEALRYTHRFGDNDRIQGALPMLA